ncbi:MAG TPA: efflux transporter outer membrane subunit [Sphingomicrobium sp.]|nr:efflux transporter outer membrane subunit [Sphingomicrobium sp.]
MHIRTFFIVCVGLSAASCTVGPDYRRPTITGDTHEWVEPSSPGPVDISWWRNFNDPVLDRLIDRAITSSPDVAEATARIAEARANRDAARGGREPMIVAKGSATENVLSKNGQLPIGSIPAFAREFRLFDIGFDASWELDLWGRHQREIEGANARVAVAQFARRDVMLSLIAEVARNYVDLRSAEAETSALKAIAAADAELARLSELRFVAGEISRQEADQAIANASTSRAAVPDSEAKAAAAAYRITALVGAPPEELAPELLRGGPLPSSPETILTGVRSDLLTRRPDVARAERELAAATADIGVAKADLFPRFSLLGRIGQQARNPGDLPSSDSTRFQMGPSFSWPVFALGTIRARIRSSDARADEAAAQYEKAVLGALSDSETAINRFLRASAALRAAEASLVQQRAAFALAEQRSNAGEDDRIALEDARKTLISSERRRDQANASKSEAAINLYKALGGGWRNGP